MIGCRVVGLFLVVTMATACNAPSSPPTPADILNKPAQSDMRDGHFTAKLRLTSGILTLTGDGTMILKPRYAFSMSVRGSVGQLSVAMDYIFVNGESYSRSGNEQWSMSPSQSEPGNPGSKARNPKLIGEDNLSKGKCWHVRGYIPGDDPSSGQTFDACVRESDGYLAKYTGTGSAGTISLEFDRYNTGVSVSTPPSSDVKPQ